MLLVVLGVSLGKYFCYNRYHAALPKLCAVIRADAAAHPGAKVIDGYSDTRRLAFYTGLPVEPVAVTGTWERRIREMRKLFRKPGCTLYWVCREGDGPPFAPEVFGVKPQNWERLYSTYFSNRKNALLSVYRCRRPAAKAKPKPKPKKTK